MFMFMFIPTLVCHFVSGATLMAGVVPGGHFDHFVSIITVNYIII